MICLDSWTASFIVIFSCCALEAGFFFLQGQQARRQSRLKACFKVIGGIIQQLLFLGLALLARAAGERWVGDWGEGENSVLRVCLN